MYPHKSIKENRNLGPGYTVTNKTDPRRSTPRHIEIKMAKKKKVLIQRGF